MEENTDQNNSESGEFLRSVQVLVRSDDKIVLCKWNVNKWVDIQ